MLPLLANRMQLYQAHRLFDYHHPNPEYIIIDRDWSRIVTDQRWREDYYELMRELQRSPHFAPIYESADYIVYRRLSSSAGIVSRRRTATLCEQP